MAYGVKLHVRGARRLLHPAGDEGRAVSYDTLTPSAARGVREAIHWKPAILWMIGFGRNRWPEYAGGGVG